MLNVLFFMTMMTSIVMLVGHAIDEASDRMDVDTHGFLRP